MKNTIILLFSLLMVSCCKGKELIYTGSTPADVVIRSFLNIPLPDSIDFIRWKLILGDNRYKLQCNYGIGKPNTNGFIKGGRQVELSGKFKKESNYYQLQHHDKTLNIVALNNNLLHLLNTDKKLLVGNGGWSYTLNNISPSPSDEINIGTKQTGWKDSIAFEGRTPCNVPGIIPAGTVCYKLKWYIVFYAGNGKDKTGQYKVLGTPWRKEGGRTGNWEISSGKNSKITYQLKDDKGNVFLYLLQLDEHILVFTDKEGKLLVGDHDFSDTLNRQL